MNLEGARAMSDLRPLTFAAFRQANVTRCLRWHPEGIESWSPSDWLTAVAGELGELASLIKMRNRERDGLVGNKFSPTDQQFADELADVLTYLDLLAAVLRIDLGKAAIDKFNAVSERCGFPDRIGGATTEAAAKDAEIAALRERAERAEAALTEIAGMDYTRAAINGMGHDAVALAQRILRGEGE